MRALGAVCLVLVACGSKPKPMNDAGPDGDGGVDGGSVDAGTDAGRERGEEPPTGWSVVLPLGDGGATTRVGVSASMALDQFGHPMVAALIVDPNGDGVRADNGLVFTRWNGVSRAYQAPVTVEILGDIDVSHPNRQVSLARNASTGVIGIVYVNEGGAVRYAHSEDEGAHFSIETVNATHTDSSKLSNPVLAYAGDTLHLAYSARPMCPGGCGKIIHRLRAGAGAFTDAEIQGSLKAPSWPFAMAVGPAGAVGFAFFSDEIGNDGGTVTLSYAAGGSVQTVMQSDVWVDNVAKTPSVSLTLQGDVPRVAFHLLSSSNADAQLWYAQKSGAAWGAPVAIPRNGPAGNLDGTQWYQAVLSEGGTKVAVVGNFQRVGAVNQQCGGPKLGRSPDGVGQWSVCHPPEQGGPTVHALGQAGLWLNMASHRPNKLTLALTYEQSGNPAIGGGVLIYREP